MALVSLQHLHLSFGNPPLLDDISFSIEPGERVCLMGRNGEGKSTLMKVVAGEQTYDDGDLVVQKGVRIARLMQEVPREFGGKVFDLVADGLGDLAGLVKSYHQASLALAEDGSQQALDRLAAAQHELEAKDGWQLEQRVEAVLSRMELDAEADFAGLSGGMKRRVMLARALALDPHLLLLDEPTNHLDLDAIDWLEQFLSEWRGALLFVTHDRAFMQRLATRILELDRGLIYDWPGDFDNYLRRRAETDNAEAKANARFDKKMAQEEVWIRQGIKARRTRNEGRVRQLQEMRRQYASRRSRQGSANMELNQAERSGKLVAELEHVNYAWSGKPIVRDLSFTLMRGDRVGIIGPNGCGKSTLLNLILGNLKPDSGQIKLGNRIEVVYFDQLRNQLDEDATVLDNVAGGSDKVEINGQAKHVISYLQDFLFSPARTRQPVRALSGGERNRLLLAKLFTKPANVLVMDEPTNDLDVETLELLEELLLSFEGTLLLVSHDRKFLDNTVTSALVFEDGQINQYVGGYSDWLAQRKPVVKTKAEKTSPTAAPTAAKPNPPSKPAKLSYKDQRELDALPALIDKLEQELAKVQSDMADPANYSDPAAAVSLSQSLSSLEAELNRAYARWGELEG